MAKSLLLVILSTLTFFGRAQDFSNKGKEFWLGYGNHQQMYTASWPGMDIYITSDVDTRVTVDIPGLGITIGVFDVLANQITTVSNITPEAFLLREGVSNKGIHVVAEKPVVVYAHIYFSSVSGATLCLPVSTLGREYYSVNFDQEAQRGSTDDSSHSYFFVVATEDNTTIEVTPTEPSLSGQIRAGVPHTQVLNRGQVFNMLSRRDLTGSVIRSVNTGTGCKKIAVFSGSGRIGIGCQGSISSSDNLFQQMYPNSTWGKRYLTAPSVTRPYNYYRIIRPDPSIQVRLDGTLIPVGSWSNNFYFQFSDGLPHYIEATKPIFVAQYFTTQDCAEETNNGDPEMIFLNPVEQTINRLTLTSMTLVSGGNEAHFVNAIVKNSPAAINTFMIDGIPHGTFFKPHPAAPGYAYAQIPVNFGTHNITCDTPFNAIAYGFSRTESYGYSAGTNLKDLYQFVSIQNDFGTVNFPSSCKGSPFRMSMTFPYEPTQISWIFGAALNTQGIADVIINSPVSDSSWLVDGRTLYRYKLTSSFRINNAGIYPIVVKAVNPTTDGCSGDQEIEYDLQIFERPKAAVQWTHNGCHTDSVAFEDKTDDGGRPLVKWYWDFDEGVPPDQRRNLKYRYQTAGTFTVRHAAITDIGCVSDTSESTIVIANPPTALFAPLDPLCEKKAIGFSNQSTSSGEALVQWHWDFGDGNITSAPNGNSLQHTYNTTGTYPVSLQVGTARGCLSTVFTDQITIHHLPVAAFSTPEVCIDDPFAEFTDKSTIADNTEAKFTYNWNFGDNTALSTLKNARHKYGNYGNYQVQLQVTSQYGCQHSVTQPMRVNSNITAAAFAVQGGTAGLCSNEEVNIKDASQVAFGDLTRVVIYWDYLNDPTNKTEDETPSLGKSFAHKFPEFGSPATRTVRVLYEAYTGTNCSRMISTDISLKASPAVQFDPMAAVCEEIDPFLVRNVTVHYGFGGVGDFSGPGISPEGMFDPGIAKPGLHTIRYRYRADNGCSTYEEQTIRVYPTPGVDAGPDKGVLPDGIITLLGSGTGNNVRYAWSPLVAINDATRARPAVSPKEDTYYTLTVTSADGCVAKDEVFVRVLKKIVVPNAFTPNGDGINDTWIILFLDSYAGCTVDVFNRFGQKVHSSTGYGKIWDGTMNGRPLPVGTYYYVINPRNGKPLLNGSVTIIR